MFNIFGGAKKEEKKEVKQINLMETTSRVISLNKKYIID